MKQSENIHGWKISETGVSTIVRSVEDGTLHIVAFLDLGIDGLIISAGIPLIVLLIEERGCRVGKEGEISYLQSRKEGGRWHSVEYGSRDCLL
ncbi:unnamed protein product [Callosobruchus maculatus]|uniref:Uncharacterized protein n=1 Tax=Callosobruchus maculatus TaxID=64391 RepID=A0A653BS29_CALMS|nr:unnamed protein product [Callosobruchus maculatus]